MGRCQMQGGRGMWKVGVVLLGVAPAPRMVALIPLKLTGALIPEKEVPPEAAGRQVHGPWTPDSGSADEGSDSFCPLSPLAPPPPEGRAGGLCR